MSKNGFHSKERWLKLRLLIFFRFSPFMLAVLPLLLFLNYWWWIKRKSNNNNKSVFSHGITTDIYHFVCCRLNRVFIERFDLCLCKRYSSLQVLCAFLLKVNMCACIFATQKKIRVWKTTFMRENRANKWEREREKRKNETKKINHVKKYPSYTNSPFTRYSFLRCILKNQHKIRLQNFFAYFFHHKCYVCLLSIYDESMMWSRMFMYYLYFWFVVVSFTHSPAHEYHHTRWLVY